MKNYLEIGEEDCAGTQRAAQPLVSPGILSALHLVNVHELQDLRSALAKGFVPPDLEAKLAKLAKESLLHQFVEQNCRLFIALLAAGEQRSFTEANPAATERLLRVLAYVRKDDDAIADYRSDGFVDDQQELREVTSALNPMLQEFKAWRLRHQVPGMWQGTNM